MLCVLAEIDFGYWVDYGVFGDPRCFVGTYNPEKVDNLQVPGFYCRESGVPSPYGFESFAEAARVSYYQGMVGSGSVFCIPPPQETAMDSEYIRA